MSAISAVKYSEPFVTKIGGTLCSPDTRVSSTQITCGTPSSGTAGPADVLVTNSDTQTATLTRLYSFTPNQTAASGLVGTSLLAPLPAIFLQPGFTMVVSITNVQVGDQVSAIRVYREAFDTGPEGYPLGMVEENMYVGQYERLGD